METPVWRPLSHVVQDDRAQRSFGDREGHVAGAMRLNAAATLIVCLGGWVDGESSDDVIGCIVPSNGASATTPEHAPSHTSSSWRVLATAPQLGQRAGATLVSYSHRALEDSLLYYGGLDLTEYDCVGSVHLITTPARDSSESNVGPGAGLAVAKLDIIPTLAQPAPRQRHSACSGLNAAAGVAMLITGGSDDDNTLLCDVWALCAVASASAGTGAAPSFIWREVVVGMQPGTIPLLTPRAASCMLALRCPPPSPAASAAIDSGVAFLIVGGLRFDATGSQEALSEVLVLQIASPPAIEGDTGAAAATADSPLIGTVAAAAPFLPMPVNCMLHGALARDAEGVPVRALLFGGKDRARGCDDLFVVELARASSGAASAAATEQQSGPLALEVRSVVIPCPFREVDADDPVVSRLNNEADNCWPHWRYAAAAVSWRVTDEQVAVACIGGTCRHQVDDNSQCVVATFVAPALSVAT